MGISDRDYTHDPSGYSNSRSPYKHHWRNFSPNRRGPSKPDNHKFRVGIIILIFLTLILGILAFKFPTFRNWLESEYKQIKIRLFWRGENGESTLTMVNAALPSSLDIVIKNNPNAINPSWNQLLKFLEQDKTDTYPYIEGKFVCGNFALMLHDNAEIAGWRCAYVTVYLSGVCHALNAFKTTDSGLVYIDCTNGYQGPSNMDNRVDLKNGMEYLPKNIFPEKKWGNTRSMGIISDISIFW